MEKLFAIFFFTLLNVGCDDGNFKSISSELLLNDALSKERLISELIRLEKWKTKKESFDDSTNAFMFTNKLVVDLVKNPDSHFKMLEEEISKSNIEVNTKILWIQLSQCVSDTSYLELVEHVLDSSLGYDEKLTLLKNLLSPGFEWGTRFSEKYFRPKYKSILNKISDQQPLSQDLKGSLDLIVNGTNANYLRAHRGIEGEYPRISCRK